MIASKTGTTPTRVRPFSSSATLVLTIHSVVEVYVDIQGEKYGITAVTTSIPLIASPPGTSQVLF